MKIVFFLTCFISITLSAHGQADRLQNLKEQRNSAIDRAIAPINDRYLSELKKLLKTATTSGQLEEALVIKNEIALIEKESLKSSSESENKGFTENFLVGTKWEQGGGIILKFEKGKFQVHKKDKNGNYVGGDYRNWEIEDIKKRKIKIFWHSGAERATLNRRLTEIKGSKNTLKLIED